MVIIRSLKSKGRGHQSMFDLQDSNKKQRAYSIFSGVGGLELGLHRCDVCLVEWDFLYTFRWSWYIYFQSNAQMDHTVLLRHKLSFSNFLYKYLKDFPNMRCA